MNEDDNMIPFYKDHGFPGEWSNVIESTYDLLRILEYCVSDDMNYTPEAKEQIQGLIDWINSAAKSMGNSPRPATFPEPDFAASIMRLDCWPAIERREASTVTCLAAAHATVSNRPCSSRFRRFPPCAWP